MEFKIYYKNNKTKIIEAKDLNINSLWQITHIQPIHITHGFPKFELSKPIIWKVLVDYGLNPHALDEYVLRWSAGNGHIDVVKYLVSIGGDPHAQNEHALRRSAISGHLDVVKYFVSIGCDINKINLEYVVNNDIKEYILKQS